MVRVIGGRGRRDPAPPLRRFLRSQVGRAWDKVYSEICEYARHGSRDLRDEVRRLVHFDVVVEQGVVRRVDRKYDWRGGGLASGSLYVCPRTGILRVVKERKTDRKKKEPQTPQPIKLGNLRECRYLDGGWHLVEVRQVPAEWTPGSRNTGEVQEEVTVLHRLSKRELKQYPIPMHAWKG
jgi:hypothetical protein